MTSTASRYQERQAERSKLKAASEKRSKGATMVSCRVQVALGGRHTINPGGVIVLPDYEAKALADRGAVEIMKGAKS